MVSIGDKNITDFRKLLSDAEMICVIAHSHPDGDAVGSSMALYHFLTENSGVAVNVILPDAWPPVLNFIVPDGTVIDAGADFETACGLLASCDLVICLDFNSFNRVAGLEKALEGSRAPKVIIDHHPDPHRENFRLVFSDTEVSSTCELLYHILLRFPGMRDASFLPPGTAEALMVGMTTDTNNFANSVFPSTLSMASDLLASGVDRDGIISELYSSYRENRVRALGYMLSELLHITDSGVAYFVLRSGDWKRFGLEDGETEGFVNIPLSIDRVRMSIFLKEDDGFFRVSIRSKRGTSANRIAVEHFNGGGHECASGGKLYFPGDIASPALAESYIENVTARFLQNKSSDQV